MFSLDIVLVNSQDLVTLWMGLWSSVVEIVVFQIVLICFLLDCQ